VAVLDIQMPIYSGIEVARKVRARRLSVGLLILTAYNDDPYVMAVLRAGANGYVLKTASPDELIQAVRDVRDGKMAFDAAISPRLINQATGQTKETGIEKLSEREMDVLRQAAKGFTNKAIAMQLSISDRTVQGHLAHIYDKLQAAGRTEAVMRAVALGWIAHDVGTIADE
jgi:DNA-binding NarL/FixJ family response regulator